MAFEVDAIYSNGAFVPVTPLEIQDGIRVHLRIDEQKAVDTSAKRMTRAEMQEFLRMMESLPNEGPDDGFSSVDHDKILYGKP